ncbi:hypothetical protein COCSADRAFT_349314 [Bipolaris sorokiniana ND90Pr]|uniref:RING-type domain-containing protein n=1 Tax=Cochliobolus sativus (strain ND90Pr / ATCC 201652) TaxID=665912 RepID=M2T0E1_COCSN|nr:uncharacterized protein COCSADRAFT_349314 [Bipolaris sorokiniana ND90Pr]EMD68025.1 hypothetical protein COCSADRAFT_349314 [Bipolaris sorokiniana ND90Pr]
MPLFSGKEAFIILGLSPIQPSLHHRSENCTVCTLPLTMHPGLPILQRPPHPATRINLCNHIVGKECLLAWLDISCACPVCNRTLFDATDEEITERDVAFVYKKLRQLWRKGEILAAIERVITRKRFEQEWREERAPGVDPVEEKGEGEDAVFEGEFWDGSEDGDEEMKEEEGSEEGEIIKREGMDDDKEGYDQGNEGDGYNDVGGSEDMDISDSSE